MATLHFRVTEFKCGWHAYRFSGDVNQYTVHGMNHNCVQSLVIACVFSIDIFNVSSTLVHLCEPLSVSIPPFIHPCIQSCGQSPAKQSSQPRHSASPDGWSKPITAALMLWLASVPASLTPSSFYMLPPCLTHPLISSPLFLCTSFDSLALLFRLKCLRFSPVSL